MHFHDMIAAATPLDDGYALDVPESWYQGRTAFGGMTSALGHEAARKLVPDMPVLRSAQVSFVGPISGPVEVRSRLLRRGRNASWVTSEITTEKGCGFIATYVFMSAIESKIHLNENARPDDLIAVEDALPFDNPNAPNFTRSHFDIRFAQPKPEAKVALDQREARVAWWARQKDHGAGDAMSGVLLCGDVLPPGIMPLTGFGTPVSSMQWQINLLTAEPKTDDGWWLLESLGEYAENGCSSQKMMIWNTDGEPIATGMQSVAVFG